MNKKKLSWYDEKRIRLVKDIYHISAEISIDLLDKFSSMSIRLY